MKSENYKKFLIIILGVIVIIGVINVSISLFHKNSKENKSNLDINDNIITNTDAATTNTNFIHTKINTIQTSSIIGLNSVENILIETNLKEENITLSVKEDSAKEMNTTTIDMATISDAMKNDNINYLGNFKVTAYCGCEQCCGVYAQNRDIVTGAIGEPLINNYSIAVDPNIIPYYSTVYINGQAYVAHDTGGAIKGNRIDIYFENHQDAVNFGVQYLDVYK